MKNLRKITALILTLLLTVVSLPTVSVFANNSTYTDMYYGKKMLSQMYNSDNLIRVYELLVDGCADFDEKIDIPNNVSINRDELLTVYSMFYGDYPEYFWVGNGSPGYTMYGNKVIKVAPIYSTSGMPNMVRAKAEYNEVIAELTRGLNGKSDYEKSKILHDRVCDTITYALGNNHQSSYGALVEGKAVCNGYARAYQHLLKEVGIAAWYVKGTSYEPSTNARVAHAWNIVKLDGRWYYTDTTWDDQDYILYSYMNITTNELLEDHIIDSSLTSLLPHASSTYANYYVRENLIFQNYDRAKLIEALSNDEFMAQVKIEGNIDSFYSQFLNDRMIIANALSSTPAKSIFTMRSKDIFLIDYEINICATHRFDNNCDSICNNCGFVRNPTHSYKTVWDKNAVNHWRECSVCSDKTDVTAHEFDNSCDTNCNVCGFERRTEHSFGGDHICDGCGFGDVNIAKIFPDTDNSAWYSDAVAYAYSRGIIKGYQNGNFGASDGIQRQDFLVMLARFDGVDLTEYGYECTMPDVARGSYYESAVNWGVANGITTGYIDGTFGVGDMITREQIVTFLYRYAHNVLYMDVTPENENKAKTYPDYKNVSEFSTKPIIWAIDKGVINGKQGKIAPQGNAQRCEIAQIMYNIFKNKIF